MLVLSSLVHRVMTIVLELHRKLLELLGVHLVELLLLVMASLLLLRLLGNRQ